jgi:PAS domain S-box-containing protein
MQTSLSWPVVGGLRQWWRELNPTRQDRLAMLAPLASVLIFFLAIVAALTYLRVEEMNRDQEAIERDLEYAQQTLRQRLTERQEQLSRLSREITSREASPEQVRMRINVLLNRYPEVQGLAWVDENRRVRAAAGSATVWEPKPLATGPLSSNPDHDVLFLRARTAAKPFYYQALRKDSYTPMLQLVIPLQESGRFSGALMTEYSVDGLYRYGIPTEISARYAVSITDARGTLLAGVRPDTKKFSNRLPDWISYPNSFALNVSPLGTDLTIRAQAYRASLGVVGSGLFWLVGVLSLLTGWMLVVNWRHTRKRLRTQQALVTETNFRRAMENSMLTGMRAMDLQGRITFVNAAFCQMTGWSDVDLIGKSAPFPYWPDENRADLHELLAKELSGQTQAGGVQIRVKRRDGSVFDARLYVAPLIDAFGTQTGWVTSMTDITEPNRIREELSRAHRRFTTVLEALEASISVAPLGSDELLFANKTYRQWFHADAAGHLQLAAEAGVVPGRSNDESSDAVDSLVGFPVATITEQEAENAEIFIPALGKWLEVRTRYLSWVDGRLAQMVIATDISARRIAEEQAALQAERAQSASRMVTMGEMASSVAHELNQPLTAINNYCLGMVSRIKAQQINQDELLVALEKTSRQAQRAGQIIQRIREFVKRSEPNLAASSVNHMVDETVELAEVETRRFNVRLNHYIAPNLPPLRVDPILIQQVLLNLLRNAAESIESAARPPHQRTVDLRVGLQQAEGQTVVQFAVSDTGIGIAPGVMERLYEAFYTTKSDGMGMGLSLCRSIIESHRGRIQAENIYNGSAVLGCRFAFWIPLDMTLPGVERVRSTV